MAVAAQPDLRGESARDEYVVLINTGMMEDAVGYGQRQGSCEVDMDISMRLLLRGVLLVLYA